VHSTRRYNSVERLVSPLEHRGAVCRGGDVILDGEVTEKHLDFRLAHLAGMFQVVEGEEAATRPEAMHVR